MGGKRKTHAKRSLSSLPKGLPVRGGRGGGGGTNDVNPFDITQRTKRPKFHVLNRNGTTTTPGSTKSQQQQQQLNSTRPSALLVALEQRKTILREALQRGKKVNVFHDRRIGEYDQEMTKEQQTLARLVRERTQRSKKNSKYSLDDTNDDDNDLLLTHKGQAISSMTPSDHIKNVILSDDDDDDDKNNGGGGNLDATDTLMHFGGGQFDREKRNVNKKMSDSLAAYGPSSGSGEGKDGDKGSMSLANQYGNDVRKMDLEELILRRKLMKAEKLKVRDEQVTTFEQLDESFQEISQMLQFRDKEKDMKEQYDKKKLKQYIPDEMDEWDKEMKQYLYTTSQNKGKATDRTKTSEEIAKEEYDRLHELETKRLARMNGDFQNDDLDDISTTSSENSNSDNDDDNDVKRKIKSKYIKKIKKHIIPNDNNHKNQQHPEALDNESDNEHDDDDKDTIETRFTADGLVQINKKDGRIIGKVGEMESESNNGTTKKKQQQQKKGSRHPIFKIGTKVNACYRVEEQKANGLGMVWYSGKIVTIHKQDEDENDDGTGVVVSYKVKYDDGEYEDYIPTKYIQQVTTTTKGGGGGDNNKDESNSDENSDHDDSGSDDDGDGDDKERIKEVQLKKKKKIAKDKARSEIPYVFEVPTTLDALHEVIGKYATTGEDVTTIIQRIHKGNSVRLDRRNAEKIQNFYDVLIRRFLAVGDAIYKSGDGGNELHRYEQLDSLTQILYEIAQEAPEIAASVWSRRIGFLHKAHLKRLRDAEFTRVDNDDEGGTNKTDEDIFTAWPSTGVVLLLRVIGHIFPVTDKKHPIVTPVIILLAQMLTTTPVLSTYDLTTGLMCCGLLLEYTKDAKRVAPEAHAFIASVIRLYGSDPIEFANDLVYPLPTIGAATKYNPIRSLRKEAAQYIAVDGKLKGTDGKASSSSLRLSLEKEKMQKTKSTSAAILFTVLHFAETTISTLGGTMASAEREAFAEIAEAILKLDPKKKPNILPTVLQSKIVSVAATLEQTCQYDQPRVPLQRRAGPTTKVMAIKSLAPRLENPERYSLSKDKGKNATQAALDRTRREYKREHKAISRELRLDGAFIESERRTDQDKRDRTAKAKRHRAFAWLEGEQAVMNQQVRQGGGLLQGGGTGAARIKARTGQLGIKKGGKL